MVTVSWTKDRERYKRVLGELPGYRRLRRRVRWLLGASALLLIIVVLTGVTADAVIVALVPGAMGLVAGTCVRRTVLGEIGAGTLSWRFDATGLRIEGDTATEIPWRQMVQWRRASGHLIIEVRRPNGKQPHSAVAAPLEAFSAPAWDGTEALLRRGVGRT